MPNEIDRTEVVIDTSLNDDQANKQISELEDRLNNLQKPRDIDLSFDKVYKRLEQIKFDLSEELSHKTLSQQRISNEDILRYQGISSLMKHMVEDRNSITPADLRDILESVELNLSSDTTSNIASQQNEAKDLDLSEIDRSISDAMGSFADQAATFKQLIHSYNVLAMKFNKMPTAAENSPALKEQYNALVSRIEQIIALMKEKFPGFQMPGKTDKGKYDLPYANKVDEFVKQLQNDLKPQQQQQPQSQKQDNTLGNIFRALVGVRTLFSLVRRIASQNEQLTTAVNNFMTTVANLLAPILNFLAAIINTIAG